MDACIADEEKRLVLFIQEDDRVGKIDSALYDRLKAIVEEINLDSDIRCSVEIVSGSFTDAKARFLNCSHYIITRTCDAVYFSCLADKLDIEIISGVDSKIQFKKSSNMCKFD